MDLIGYYMLSTKYFPLLAIVDRIFQEPSCIILSIYDMIALVLCFCFVLKSSIILQADIF